MKIIFVVANQFFLKASMEADVLKAALEEIGFQITELDLQDDPHYQCINTEVVREVDSLHDLVGLVNSFPMCELMAFGEYPQVTIHFEMF